MILQKMPASMSKARDLLLQKSLRPDFHDYPITREYPIVLQKGQNHFSYCASSGGKNPTLLAHANLWPRILMAEEHSNPVKIALIGNVVTREEFRGQGIMKKLLDYLWKISKSQGVRAMLLWSDLPGFYQKLGFSEQGEELRFTFKPQHMPADLWHEQPTLEFVSPGQTTPEFLRQLLSLRYPSGYQISRSPGEFQTLLKIPDTCLIRLRSRSGSTLAYTILGKGYEMPGVLHEWGAESPDLLILMLERIFQHTAFSELRLLSPLLEPNWIKRLSTRALTVEKHKMAFIRTDDPAFCRDVIPDAFIWGLDTI